MYKKSHVPDFGELSYFSMMKGIVERYARKRITRLRKLLDSCTKTLNVDVLHHIRVEIKKIKTLLKLLHFHNKKFDDSRTFKPFRKIFRACGEMRDPSLHHFLAKKLTGKDLLPAHDNSDLQQEFISSIPKYIREVRKQEKSIFKEAKNLKFNTHRRYLRKRRQKLERMLRPTFRQTALHSTRKVIKEILYLSAIVVGKRDVNPFYDKSAGLIGDWHDKMMLIERLRVSRKPHKMGVKALQKKCAGDLKALKELINVFYKDPA